MGGFSYVDIATQLDDLGLISSGGGLTYSSDGFLAQQAGQTIPFGGGETLVTYVASLPDADENVTEAAGVITVNNSGFYAVSIFGEWVIDDSTDTERRRVQLEVDAGSIPEPAAQGIYAYAANRESTFHIVPNTNAYGSATNASSKFNIDFVAPIGGGTIFNLKCTNFDPANDSDINVIVSFVRLGG